MSPQQAYRKVRTALQKGDLVRPSICSKCGSKPINGTDGRATIQAHHQDYAKPLDVEWICAKCHRAETPLPRVMGAPVYGERNGQSKLTRDDVALILASSESGASLARALGMHRSTINRIRSGKYWLAAAPAGGRKKS